MNKYIKLLGLSSSLALCLLFSYNFYALFLGYEITIIEPIRYVAFIEMVICLISSVVVLNYIKDWGENDV